MTAATVSLLQVQARWAYTEIIGATLSHLYDALPNIDALRNKCQRGVPLNQFSPEEQYNLAFLCVAVRPNLMIFTTGVDYLVEVTLNRAQIATFLVPEMVSGQPGLMTFEGYMNTAAHDPADARNVPPPAGGYQNPSHPLTAGRLFNSPVLLDGYHRAAAFRKFGPADGVIRAYLPIQLMPPA